MYSVFFCRGHVTTLILKLALHAEVSLQTLAFRLDYSDFYKRGNAKLHEPLTYQHKRLSEIGLNLAKVTPTNSSDGVMANLLV